MSTEAEFELGEYETGSVVTLKSGGPEMTVRVHQKGRIAREQGWPEYVSVDWLDTAGISHNQKFHPDQIARVEKAT